MKTTECKTGFGDGWDEGWEDRQHGLGDVKPSV